jgi:two-component system response regulator EvgA
MTETLTAETAVAPEVTRARTVLIVDDHAPMRMLMRAAVDGISLPCRILEAETGDDALRIAREANPDLVLLDIELPGSSTSGVLVCSQICKELRTKVVIVSGQASRAIAQACLDAGAIAYVPKTTFSIQSLQIKLEEWLAE